MQKDYYTGEVRCRKCLKWCDPQELTMGYCENCLSKLQKQIDKATKGGQE